MVAVVTADEVQLTEALRSLVVPSVKVPVAVSWRVLPNGTVEFAGGMASEASAGGASDTTSAPLMPPEAAMILATPCDAAVTNPVPFTGATAAFDELHSAPPVKSCV